LQDGEAVHRVGALAVADRLDVGVLILLATGPARGFATPATANTPFGRRLLRNLADADPVGYAACCDALAMFDKRGDLRRISAPTLVVGGVHDVATPVRHAQELVVGIAHATLETLDTAHLAVEDPRALRAVLRAHLARVDTQGASGVPPLD
jgi:pimeloyl-ACP methyl ester carboxylesterase